MSEILKKNLDLIFKYNPQLVDKILAHQAITKPVEIITADSGDPNLLYDGDFVHDNTDPVYEAIEIYQKVEGDDANLKIHILYGLGLGYLLKRFSQKSSDKIIVLEPNLDILRIVLEIVDFSEELAQTNIKIASNEEELRKCLSQVSANFSYKLILSATTFYFKNYKNQINTINAGIKNITNKEKIWDKPAKINIGAGMWKKEGWLTLDCYIKADIQIDLRNFTPFPVVNDVFEKVFSSHCIEHIEDPHLEFLLKEIYRTMQPGGILRLACPDADIALESYKNNDISWFGGIITKEGDKIGAKLLNTFVSYEAGSGGPEMPEEVVKEKFNSLGKDEFIKWCLSLCDRSRPYIAHINGIYYDKLEKMLKNAGFVNIEKSSFRNSKDVELSGPEFDRHKKASLFVECYKP
ncbi:MAG TPA: hypothetical protein P5556_08215 [Candidatus Gastranaerophilales bacterium]|nr:hypothetical protein [Candidatus Gastranaerophilales bacterium]